MQTLREYITNSSEKAKKAQISFRAFGNTEVIIKDPLPEAIDVHIVFKRIKDRIPAVLLHGLDMIYVGDFEYFKDREINAMYDSGAIYVSNEQDDEEDMIDDIVHEIAHMIEENHGVDIYGDGELEGEFLSKRISLERILRFNEYNTFFFDFKDPEYSENLDVFFYSKVGYPKLDALSDGLFISPYAATSLREYFATGLEEYYLGDRKLISNICPKLYKKLDNLNNKGE